MIPTPGPTRASGLTRPAHTRCRLRHAFALLVLIATLPAACSRSVDIATTPAITYAINVTNAAGTDLAVTYDDGAGPRALGLVNAGRSERFVIAAPRSTTVTISGVAPDGSRAADPVEIQLQAGTTVPVTLR